MKPEGREAERTKLVKWWGGAGRGGTGRGRGNWWCPVMVLHVLHSIDLTLPLLSPTLPDSLTHSLTTHTTTTTTTIIITTTIRHIHHHIYIPIITSTNTTTTSTTTTITTTTTTTTFVSLCSEYEAQNRFPQTRLQSFLQCHSLILLFLH